MQNTDQLYEVKEAQMFDHEWRDRLGRFEGCEKDTEDRPQIKPGDDIAVSLQTHSRERGEYHDGTTKGMDS